MDSRFVFLIHGIAHFMATDTELEFIGRFHRSIKAAPEDNTANEKYGGDSEYRIFRAGLF
jgi:hypothetical protein